MPDHDHRWLLDEIQRTEPGRHPSPAVVHMHCDCGARRSTFTLRSDDEIQAGLDAQ